MRIGMTLKRLGSMQKIYYGTSLALEHQLKIPTNDTKTYTLNLRVKNVMVNSTVKKLINNENFARKN
jgi:hypothetical protein